jgi:hypothetical protein
MDKRNKGIILLFVSVTAIFLIIMFPEVIAFDTSKYQKGNDYLNIEYSLDSDPYCDFSKCYLYMKEKVSGTSLLLDSKQLEKNDMFHYFAEDGGHNPIYKIEKQIYVKIPYTYRVATKEAYDCSDYEITGNCVDKSVYEYKTGYKWEWVDYKDAKVPKDEYYKIRYIGYFEPTTDNFRVDIVPCSYGLCKPEFAWWSGGADWNKCMDIEITENDGEDFDYYSLNINVTYDSDMQSDFDDLRFVNASCGDGGSEIYHWTEEKIDSSWSSEWVRVDNIPSSDTRTISVYYDYDSASDNDDPDNTFIYYDDCDDTSGWTDDTGTISASGGWCNLDGGGSNTEKSHLTGSNAGDARIVALIEYDASAGNGDVGIYGRGDTYWYQATLDNDIGDQRIYDSNGWGVLDNDAFSTSIGSIYRMEEKMDGNTISLTTNGTTSSGTDNDYTTGEVGSRVYRDSIKIDYIFVGNYTTTEPTYSFGSEETNENDGSESPLWERNTTTSIPTEYDGTGGSFGIWWINGSDSANSYVNTTYVLIEHNISGVANYTMTLGNGNALNGSYSYSSMVIPAGSYYWKSYAKNNDTTPGWNTSDTWYFTVGKAVNNLEFTITNETSTYQYPTVIYADYGDSITACGTCSGDQYILERNGTNVNSTNCNPVSLAVSWYNYTFQCVEDQNYSYNTSASEVRLIYQRGNPSLDIIFNASSPVTGGTVVSVNCSSVSQISSDIKLYNDTSETSIPFIWDTSGLEGVYNFTCNISETQNYTSETVSESITIGEAGALIINSVKDEETLSPLTFNISIYNDTFSTSSDNVLTYNNNSVQGELTVSIESYGYISRNYYINISEEDTVSLDGFLLKNTDGVYINFWAYSNTNPAGEEDVEVSAIRFLDSSWETVEQQKSDFEGKGTLFLSPYAEYKINATKGENNVLISSYNPNALIVLKLNLGGEGEAVNVTWDFTNLYYYLEPTYIYITNSTNNLTLINYTLYDSDNALEYMGMNISLENGTVLYSNNTSTSSGTSILVYFNSTGKEEQTITVKTWFKRYNYEYWEWDRTYILFYRSSWIPEVIEGLAFGGTLGISEMFSNLIAMFVSLGISAGSSKFLSNTGGEIVYLLVLSAFVMFGFFEWIIFLNLALIGFILFAGSKYI